MDDNDNSKRYSEIYAAFDDLTAGLEPSDQDKLDDLINECGAHTKALLCTLMEQGQTLSEAIDTLTLMLEVLRERRQLKRRLEEEKLVNSVLAIKRKKKLWRELMQIVQRGPSTITEAIFGM